MSFLASSRTEKVCGRCKETKDLTDLLDMASLYLEVAKAEFLEWMK